MIFFLDGFQCSDDLMQQLLNTKSIYYLHFLDLMLLFYLIPIQDILYMIFHFLGMFYKYDKTINQRFQKKNYFRFLILHFIFGNYLRKIQEVF